MRSTGCKINWEPYISAAVRAVLTDKDIEECVTGDIYGQDAGAGFEEGWVEMLELNGVIAAQGTIQKIDETIEAFKQGNIHVFQGNYIGVNPYDENDTYDLDQKYPENENSSAPIHTKPCWKNGQKVGKMCWKNGQNVA